MDVQQEQHKSHQIPLIINLLVHNQQGAFGCLPAMKLLTAEAVEPLSFFAFSTALSTTIVPTCFAFSGTDVEDFAMSAISPIALVGGKGLRGRKSEKVSWPAQRENGKDMTRSTSERELAFRFNFFAISRIRVRTHGTCRLSPKSRFRKIRELCRINWTWLNSCFVSIYQKPGSIGRLKITDGESRGATRFAFLFALNTTSRSLYLSTSCCFDPVLW